MGVSFLVIMIRKSELTKGKGNAMMNIYVEFSEGENGYDSNGTIDIKALFCGGRMRHL